MDYAAHIVKPKKTVRRSILLKGPSGSGKTFQFRTLVEGGMKVLYACVDEHIGTVEDIVLEQGVWPLEQLDIPLMPSEKNVNAQDFIKLMDYLRTEDHPYDAVFFDSLMNYADQLLYFLKHIKKFSGYDLWGVYGEKLKMMLKLLTSLTSPTQKKPVHVIATWGVEVDQDWEGRRAITPIVSGKMVRGVIDYYFDDVFYLNRKANAEGDEQYVLHTAGTHEFAAKVSSGVAKLPALVSDPNLFRIIKKIQGDL